MILVDKLLITWYQTSFHRHPIDYHRHNSNKQARYAITSAYISKVVIAAFLLCMPKFFESKVIQTTDQKEVFDYATNATKIVSNMSRSD